MTTSLQIGNWIADPSDGSLKQDDIRLRLQPRVMKLLVYLAEHKGEVVSKERLIEHVWEGRIITDDAIVGAIVKLRKALADEPTPSLVVETLPKLGYQLLEVSSEYEAPVPRAKKDVTGWILTSLLLIFGLFWVWNKLLTTSLNTNKVPIAVLPLESLSNSTDLEYVAQGLTQEVISNLSSQETFIVTAKTSSNRFKDSQLGAKEIGEQLNVRYLVTGQVSQLGSDIKLSLQLIDTEQETQLAQVEHSDALEQLLEVQEKTLVRLNSQLRRLFTLPSPPEKTVTVPVSYEENDLFWIANFQLSKRTVKGIDTAITTYKQLITQYGEKPGYLYSLAQAYLIKRAYAGVHRDRLIELAQSQIEKASRLDPESTLAMETKGLLAWNQQKIVLAKQYFEHLIQTDPNRAQVKQWLGEINYNSGDLDRALLWLNKAKRLDPLNPQINRMLGRSLISSGKFEKGRDLLLENMELDKFSPNLHLEMARWSFNYGNGETLAWAKKAYEIENEQMESIVAMAYGHMEQQQFNEAWRYVSKVLKDSPDNPLTMLTVINFYLVKQDFKQLLQYVSQIEGKKTNSGLPDFIRVWLGVGAYINGELPRAIEILSSLIESDLVHPSDKLQSHLLLLAISVNYGSLLDKEQQIARTETYLSQLKSLKWDMPFLAALELAYFKLINDEFRANQLLQKFPNLNSKFQSWLYFYTQEMLKDTQQ